MSTIHDLNRKKPFNTEQPLLPKGDFQSFHYRKKQRSKLLYTIAALALFGTSCVYLSHHLPTIVLTVKDKAVINDSSSYFWDRAPQPSVIAPGISYQSFEEGLAKCRAINSRSKAVTNTSRRRHRNPHAPGDAADILIRNGHLWLGDRYLEAGDIHIQNGLITAVGENLDVHITDKKKTRIIDAGGRVVTPGIIDMHSHMTVDSLTGLKASDDTNEMTTPTTPYVRVIDALSPTDPGLKIVASGGITTSLILPGSGNLMGGEAAVIKLRPIPTLSNEDMLIGAGVADEDEEITWRYMKMACGENPKSYYGGELNQMPSTRLGENYLFRRRFEEAQQLLRKQDDWCVAAAHLKDEETTLSSAYMDHRRKRHPLPPRLTERFPENIQLESLTALLRKHVNLNVHCYLPQDIEAMVRHSQEFDFEIAAFHHALSAWQVPDIIKRAKTNITVATFADMWGYKAEAWDQNVHAPKILDEAGIPVAFKSDHPVTNARDLMHEAQKAYHYGFDEHKALQAVTVVPSRSLKLDHRIGSIAVGKDADLVIWERHPLRLGARPKQVFIDGVELDFDSSWTKTVADQLFKEGSEREPTISDTVAEKDHHYLPPFSTRTMHLEDHGSNNPVNFDKACKAGVDSYVLRNIAQIYVNSSVTLKTEETGRESLSMIVTNGRISCVGFECDRNRVDWPKSSPIFDMGGAVIIPGIISVGSPLGLFEIQAEDTTQDGYAKNDVSDNNLHKTIVRAVDGLKFGGLHLQKALKSGVTKVISQPQVNGDLLAGVSVAFRTGGQSIIADSARAIIKEEVALHFVIQHNDKMTVSRQIATIRELLLSNVQKTSTGNILAKAVMGLVPVVVQIDDKDEIASILNIKQTLNEIEGFNVDFVILGGAEAHLVAEHLARLDVPVILMPARCYPTTWQARHCLTGPPITPNTVLDVLLKNNVRVGLASTDMDNGDARNLIWEAGWNLAHNPSFTAQDAVGLVTWNIAEMFRLRKPSAGELREGEEADFIAYNSDPFEFGTRVLMVSGGGHSGPICFPQQI